MSVNGILIRKHAKEATVSAVITRADGSVEDLGTIAYWNKNPLKLAVWNIVNWFKGKRN